MYAEGCGRGAANGSHAHPCLWDVTQVDVMPGIYKLSLFPPGRGWGVMKLCPTLTLGT